MAEPSKFTQPPAYYPDGTLISPDKLDEAIASGQARWPEGSRVYVKDETGTLGSVPAEDAYHPGVRVATGEELKAHKEYVENRGFVPTAKAAALGAARGISFGLSDTALTRYGEDRDAAEELEAAKRQHSFATGAGEVAGAVAPLFLGGGPGVASEAFGVAGAAPKVAAKAGELIERGVERGLERLGYRGESLAARAAGKALSSGVGAGVEGAFYGAAGAVDDATLSGDDLTAEKLLASMGRTALFASALGAGTSGLGELSNAAAKRVFGSEGFRGVVKRFARSEALRATGFGADIPKLVGRRTGPEAEEKLAAVADDLLTYRLKTGDYAGTRVLQSAPDTQEIVKRLATARDETGAALGGVREELDKLTRGTDKAPSIEEFLGRVDRDVLAPLKESKLPGARAKARQVERQLSDLAAETETRAAAQRAVLEGAPGAEEAAAALPQPSGFAELEAWRRQLADYIYPRPPAGGGLPPPLPKAAEQLGKVERVLDSYLDETAQKALSGPALDSYLQLQRQYSSFAALTRTAQRVALREIKNRAFSPSDHALGIAAFLGALTHGNVGAAGSLIAGGVAAEANKLLRTRGNALLADWASRVAQIDAATDHAARAMADVKTAASQADEATEANLARDFQVTGKEAVKKVYEQAADQETPSPRRAAPALAHSTEELRKEYNTATERVRQLQDPGEMQHALTALTAEASDAYPEQGSRLTSKILSLYQHLTATLPPSAEPSALSPRAARLPPDAVTMQRYLSRVRGATNPQAVIGELATGHVDLDALDAVRNVYPVLWAELKGQAIKYAAMRTVELPYQKKVTWSAVFGFAADATLAPPSVQALQQMISTPQAAPPKQGGGRGAGGGRSKRVQNMLLPGQGGS